MITHRFLLAIFFAGLLPFSAFSEAPVVDDSENFALLDEQQVAQGLPVHRAHRNDSNYDEETPLATDNPDLDRGSNNNAVLLDKVQGLQQEVQELRGQLEVQAHDLKLLQQQQLAFYKDLDTRLRGDPTAAKKEPKTDLPIDPKAGVTDPIGPLDKSEANKPPVKPIVAPLNKGSSSNNPADEQISYLAAYELVKTKKFDEALTAMQAFVTQHPQGGYSANAQYWLGELHMVKKNYPEAIEHFEIVLKQFPSSSKSAASMLKIGYALAASGKKEDAIQRLQQVIKNYPDTNTALLARNKLEALNS